MSNFNLSRTLVENINEQNDKINNCIDIVNGLANDEEIKVIQELRINEELRQQNELIRQQNELLRQEQYNNNESRFNIINEQLQQITLTVNGEKTINLFNKDKIIKNYFYNHTDGSLTGYVGYNASDFIEVEYQQSYIWGHNCNICIWDENKRYVGGIANTRVFTCNATNWKYITIAVANENLDTEMVVKGSEYPVVYVGFGDEGLKSNYTNINLYNKRWAILGDSISTQDYCNRPYWFYISERNNMTVYRYAKSGSCIAKTEGKTDSFAERWQDMISADNVDIISIFGGINDYLNNIPIGVGGSNDINTFYGALNFTLKGLREKYKGKKIVYLMPLQKLGEDLLSERWLKYQNAIKEVCEYYSIQYLELSKKSNLALTLDSISKAYTVDDLHPNDEGHKIISYPIESFIASI